MKKSSPFSHIPCSASCSRFLFSLFCLLVLFLLPLSMNSADREKEETASARSEQILRFHILANSDSIKDQTLKLEVRDFLLEKIQADIQAEVPFALENSSIAEGNSLSGKQKLLACIAVHKNELETAAEGFMKQRGFSYPAQIELTSAYFPTREYAGIRFPAGTYDAVRVLLGNAEGHNWWCVLYPSLAFSAEGIKEADQETASETERNTAPEIRFKSLDWIREQKHP